MKIINQLNDVKFRCKLVAYLLGIAVVMGLINIYAGFEMARNADSLGSAYFSIVAIGILFLSFILIAAIVLYRLKKWNGRIFLLGIRNWLDETHKPLINGN